MKTIITGGTGLIGGALARSLAGDGHEVIILTRSPERSRGDFPAQVRLEAWDGRTAAGWGHLVDGANAVVNLAGESIAGEGFPPARWTRDKKARILQSRLDASSALIEAIRAAQDKPAVFVQSSAVGYYGDRDDEELTEESPAGEGFTGDVCRQWEAAAAPVADMGVRLAIIRTGVVLSMAGGAFPSFLLPFRFFIGGRMGRGDQFMPWIHLDDEVRAIRFIIETPEAAGIFNLSAPNPVQNSTLAHLVGMAMRRPSLIPTPAFLLKGLFGEVSTVLLDSQRVLPDRLVGMGFRFDYAYVEDALDDLLR